jgi:hypothetical protein
MNPRKESNPLKYLLYQFLRSLSQKHFSSWGHNSSGKHLPIKCKALGSVLSTFIKKKKQKKKNFSLLLSFLLVCLNWKCPKREYDCLPLVTMDMSPHWVRFSWWASMLWCPAYKAVLMGTWIYWFWQDDSHMTQSKAFQRNDCGYNRQVKVLDSLLAQNAECSDYST